MDSGETSGATPPSAKAIACVTSDDIGRVRELIASGEFFWIDVRASGDAEVAAVGNALGLHELTVEDLQHFGQRAKIEDFADYFYMVTYGAPPPADEDRVAEVHIVYTDRFLLTAAHDASAELRELHERMNGSTATGRHLLHALLDVLVDSFVPLLDEIEDRVEEIEEAVFARRLRELEVKIHGVRRTLSRVDRAVHRQSAVYVRLSETLRRLADHDESHTPYFRDVEDHLIRVAEAADNLRDRIQSLFEIYLAALDTRMNAIMKQFTIIAGIFLPLTVLVGFFGQNFEWMTEHVAGWVSFAIFGIGLPVVIAVGLVVAIGRRGMFRD